MNAHKNFNGRIEVAKLEELRANMENSPYTKMHGYSSVQKLTPNSVEPIYAEVNDYKVSSSLEESGYLSTSKESLYAKIGALRNENSSLEPIYAEVDYSEISNSLREKEQKKPAQKEAVENIYATVDLEQKRRDRKEKYEKSGKEYIKEIGQRFENRGTVAQLNTQNLLPKLDAVLAQKFEVGYDSGYESDEKTEKLRVKHGLPKISHSGYKSSEKMEQSN